MYSELEHPAWEVEERRTKRTGPAFGLLYSSVTFWLKINFKKQKKNHRGKMIIYGSQWFGRIFLKFKNKEGEECFSTYMCS